MTVLTYDFRVVGLRNINAALSNIERRFVQHNQRISRELGQPQRAKAANSNEGTKQITALERAQAKGHLAQLKRLEKEQQAELRAANRLAQQRDRLAAQSAAKEARERDRAAKHETRERERAAKREARAREAAAKRAAAAEFRARKQFANNTLGTTGRAVGGAIRGAGRFALGATSIMGGFAAAGAIQSGIQSERDAAMLANKALGTPGETRDRNELKRSILAQTRAVGVSSGIGTSGAIEALRQTVGISGNLPVAQKLLPFMADISDATGADIGDVGRTAGQIIQAMSTRNMSPEETVTATQDIMSSMAGQAKVGSIEFADLATQMGKVMSATSGFEGDIAKLANTMGAISQLAISGAASSPEEAMTSMLRFRDDMIANHGRFKKLGVNVFTDKSRTQLRDPMEVITEVLGSTKGDLTKIGKLFDIRGMKAFSPFVQTFDAAGGGEAGQKAVMDLIDKIRGAKMTDTEVRQSAAFIRDTNAKKIDVIMAEFNQKVGSELIPLVTKLIPEFAKLIPHIADGAKWLARFVDEVAKNPIESVGKLIAAKVALDLATAGIGGAVKSAIVRSIAGAGPVPGGQPTPKGGFGGPPSAMGSISAVVTGLTVGTLVAASIEAGFIKLFHDSEERTAKATSMLVDPTATKEQKAKRIQEARALADEARGNKRLLENIGYAASLVNPLAAPMQAEQFARGEDSFFGNSPLIQTLLDPGAVIRELADTIYGVEARTLDSTADRVEKETPAAKATKASEQLAASAEKASKSLEALAEKSKSIGTPNRGTSPSTPRVTP
jgi:hypothetical protein